jgi:DNA helicase II / ATP-dependent DNA helicase PcrA
LLDRQRGAAGISQMDLLAERAYVRETARKNVYTGKTYNSVENISQFFNERGVQPPVPKPAVAQTTAVKPALGARPPVKKKPFGAGSTVQHPSYGKGTVLRKEGEGDDTKLTVSFPGYGLKKIIAKYAGIKIDE